MQHFHQSDLLDKKYFMNEEKFMSKNILIICETGISASLLVSKLLEAIREKELSYDLDYAPVVGLRKNLVIKSMMC